MTDKLSKHIGDNLQAIRLSQGLTQSDVAKGAGTKANYYAKLERGVTLPSLKLLDKILRVLGARFRDVLP